MKTLTLVTIVFWSIVTSVAQNSITVASAGVQGYNYRTTGLYAARETERQHYMSRLFKSLPYEERYIYNQFKSGVWIDYKGVQSAKYLINYNKFLATIEYIDVTGDTLGLTDFHPARQIITEIDTFVHIPGEGFFKIDYANDQRVRLVSRDVVHVVSRHEIEDDNSKPGVPSKKEQFTAIYIPRDPILQNEQVLLATRRTTFLLDQDRRMYPVTARGFIQAFRKNRSMVENRIQARIREHDSIHFRNEADARVFLDFCNRLEKMNLH